MHLLIDKSDIPLFYLIRPYLNKAENTWRSFSPSLGFATQKIFEEERNSIFNFEMFYYPFDGHNTRLGHYYRHLFQTVSFITDSKIITSREDRYKYLKLLRAQLSNHEQLLLYYNSLSSYGGKWIENGYLSEYRMVKNIPFNSANFGIKPIDKLGIINKYGERTFEWS